MSFVLCFKITLKLLKVSSIPFVEGYPRQSPNSMGEPKLRKIESCMGVHASQKGNLTLWVLG